MKVLTLIEEGKIPNEFPHKCPCGFELEVNANKTEMWCPNPFCSVHNGHMLADTLNKLGVGEGIGENSGIELFEILGLRHPIEIFTEDKLFELSTLDYIKYRNLYVNINKLKKEKVSFYKVIDAMQLKTIGSTRAKKLFSDISRPSEFYSIVELPNKKIDEYEFQDLTVIRNYISDKLFIDSFSDTVINMSKELAVMKDIILLTEKLFNYESISDFHINVVLTGNILNTCDDSGSRFKPREKFCEYVSKKYNISCINMDRISGDVEFLIMDEDMKSNSKYKKAKSYGIEVISSDKFIELIKEKLKQKGGELEWT